MPFLSIIVPVYNTEKYVSKCIDSILNQSFRDFELIIVNDGSTDSSLNICESYKDKDCRVKFINCNNGGVTAARYTGVRQASSKWLMFVDSDDSLPNEALSVMCQEANETDLVVGFLNVKKEWRGCISLNDYRNLVITQRYVHSGPVAKLYKRELLTEWCFDIPAAITRGEDLLMNIRYAFNMTEAPKLVNKKVYNYIRRADSASSASNISFEGDYAFYSYVTKSIPSQFVDKHLDALIDFRISTLMILLSVNPSYREWKKSDYYLHLKEDMCKQHKGFSFDQYLVLWAGSTFLMKVVQKWLYTKKEY